jgi:hypothetical protein
MTTGMFDLRDLMLEASAELQDILREVAAEIAEPQMMEQFAEMWATLPMEMREQFANEKPEEYQRLMDLLSGGGRREPASGITAVRG